MRLSTDENDPGYLRWRALNFLGATRDVLLNGIKQTMVETADTELGMIVKCELNERGHIFCRDGADEVARETLYGNVAIKGAD